MRFNMSELEMREKSRLNEEKRLNEGYQHGRPNISLKVEKLFDKATWYYISEDGKTIAIEKAANQFDIYVGDELKETLNTSRQDIVSQIRDVD